MPNVQVVEQLLREKVYDLLRVRWSEALDVSMVCTGLVLR